jgi:hypothetical protein
MAAEEDDFIDRYEDDGDCYECQGDGGYNRCPEDCCMAIGGEECCEDPLCWRVCPVCKGIS